MNTELAASPRSGDVRSAVTEARDWHVYVAELRRLLGALIEVSGAHDLEVGELLLGRPLPEGLADLRNGSQVNPTEAAELVVGMSTGEGPYCRLISAGQLRIESGWDAAVHFFVTAEAAEELASFRSDSLELEQRVGAPEPVDVPTPIDGVAGEAFWARVRENVDGVTLLCERWAYGAYGCRWFRVTLGNVAEVANAVRPRSLLCVAVDPELRLEPLLLDDDFTAFSSPLGPGELTYRAYPGGADGLAELTNDGFTLMLAESVLADWCAVVPDSDGVVREQWEDPGVT